MDLLFALVLGCVVDFAKGSGTGLLINGHDLASYQRDDKGRLAGVQVPCDEDLGRGDMQAEFVDMANDAPIRSSSRLAMEDFLSWDTRDAAELEEP
jgi:hypothetical protein